MIGLWLCFYSIRWCIRFLRWTGVGFGAGQNSGHNDHWYVDLRDWRDAYHSARRGDCLWEKVPRGLGEEVWLAFQAPSLDVLSICILQCFTMSYSRQHHKNNVLVQRNFSNRLDLWGRFQAMGKVPICLYSSLLKMKLKSYPSRGINGYQVFSFEAMHPGMIPALCLFRCSINDKQWDPESSQVINTVVSQYLAVYCWRWNSWILNWFRFWFPPCGFVSKFNSHQ